MNLSKDRENYHMDISPNLGEEISLLLLLLREDTREDKLEGWLQKKRINWETFIQMALHHRVYPLLYVRLNKLKSFSIPEDVMIILKKKYQQNVFLMLELTSEMEMIGKLFDENGIPALFLKGPILAEDIYGDISLRTSKDIDILISVEDIKPTEKFLKDFGYIKKEEKSILNEDKWRSHHSVFFHPKYKFSLEVHWRLNEKPDIEPSFEILWNRRRISNLTAQSINYLGREDLFCYLISHGARHGWFRLRWLLDIVFILQKGLIWDNYKRIIKEYSNEHLVGQTLILANRLFNTSLDKAYSSLLIKKSYKLAGLAIEFIKGSNIDQPFPKELIPLHRQYTWALQKNLIQKFKYFIVLVYPSYKDFQSFELPERVHFLYFPLRPFLFAGRKMNLLRIKE